MYAGACVCPQIHTTYTKQVFRKCNLKKTKELIRGTASLPPRQRFPHLEDEKAPLQRALSGCRSKVKDEQAEERGDQSRPPR